ncbi:30S ribosomal protein S5 [Patescibacteria group bacterium]|jgi:small subunit ribosomal protein S5|nr:30S ribosomal protein S5 [Patescibacteria group bacterium]
MAEEKKSNGTNTAPAAQSFEKRPHFKPRHKSGPRVEKEKDEFQQRMVDLARVTRVMAGGKRMKFRACMVVGDANGRVGIAVAKGMDVSAAITKAVVKAKKAIINVPIVDGAIPHAIEVKFKAARVILKPAKKGSGIKAGGVVRIVLELAGAKDVVAKILGGNNKINNVKATIKALSSFKTRTKLKTVVAATKVETVQTNDKK